MVVDADERLVSTRRFEGSEQRRGRT